MNDLWCQGFFGKGSLSRSEPSWLKREQGRMAAEAVAAAAKPPQPSTSEQRTTKRREERAHAKWERGRSEFAALEQQRQQEEAEAKARVQEKPVAETAKPLNGAAANGTVPAAESSKPARATSHTTPPTKPLANGHALQPALVKAPVGPLELLALPNSDADWRRRTAKVAVAEEATETEPDTNGWAGRSADSQPEEPCTNGSARAVDADLQAATLGSLNGCHDASPKDATTSGGSSRCKDQPPSPAEAECPPTAPPKRQKSVRFSPTVESTTFVHSDPPRPNHSGLALAPTKTASGTTPTAPPAPPAPATPTTPELPPGIPNKEHLQLAPEEAFFLAYAVGALRVRDGDTGAVLSTQRLLRLLRQHSYFPPRRAAPLSTDDPFLVQYAVYHHFRALGWVPRHGIKFGVDWLLYGKGPALDHAEFGVMVLPSYGEGWGEGRERSSSSSSSSHTKSWHWLHSVNRVLSTVFKSFVLVYVDIPPPGVLGRASDDDDDVDVAALLQQYRIREVMVRRWSSNRNRD